MKSNRLEGVESAETAEAADRPLRSDAQLSRSALLEAARELVAERGPEAVTVVAVAQRAGLNRSTAYQHFRNREQLLRAVSDAFAREVREMFVQHRNFGEQVDFFVDYFRDHPDVARIWMFGLLSENRETTSEGWSDYVSAMERLATSPRSQDGVDAEMLGIIGMWSALVWSLMARRRTDDPETDRVETRRFARELKRLFLFGALRPEHWPELAAELEGGPAERST
jgi:AcrR family transcriptional regulator